MDMELIIFYIKKIIFHIFKWFQENLQNLQFQYEKSLIISPEEIEKSRTSYYYKALVLLKRYRKYIASILLIIMIWLYFCNYYNINDIDSNNQKYVSHSGGGLLSAAARFDKYSETRIKGKMSAAGKAIKGAPMAAIKGSYRGALAGRDMVAEGVGKFKAASGLIYQALFQIALVIIVFISFGPTVVFAVALIVCYALMKKKMTYLKGL